MHEVGCRMYRRRHIHVDYDEVVISAFGSWIFASGQFARLFEDTLHGTNVILPLVLR